jgi:carbonic anhydrase
MPLSNLYDANWVQQRSSNYKPSVETPETEPHYHFSYNYNGFTGPAYWHKFSATCAGKIQTPINIEPKSIDFGTTLKGVLENPKGLYPAITYPPSPGTLKNLGDTLKFAPAAATGTFWRGQNDVFQLAQFHLHAPSEHRVNGMDYPMEIHCELFY